MPSTTITKPMRWFLIKGLIRGTQHWDQFPRQMKQRFPEADIHCLDIPGNGLKYQQNSPLTVQAMAESLQQDFVEITAQDNSKENYVFASSLGGMVALQWLSQHSQQFSGAVLANSSLGNLSPFYQRMKPHNYSTILQALLMKDQEKRERLVLGITSVNSNKHALLAKKWGRFQEQFPVSRENVIRQITAASRYRYTAGQLNLPILVLNSLGDSLVDSSCSDTIAQHLNAPQWTHPTAGHDMSVDVPDWILDSLIKWMS